MYTDVSVLATDNHLYPILREEGWIMVKRLSLFLRNLCSITAAFVTFFVFMNFLIVYKLKVFMAFLADMLYMCLYIAM